MADQNEINTRIAKIYTLLCKGIKRGDVVKWAQENYKISQKQAYNYVTLAIEQRSKDLDEYKENALSDQIAILRSLYLENYKIEDYKECRAILAQIASLIGLEAAKKTDITTNGESINVSPLKWVE